MFSELPKLYDRNFVIAYLLPVGLFMMASVLLLDSFGYWSQFTRLFTGNIITDTILSFIIVWIIGIFLQILNREIYRFLEGYGRSNPLRLFLSRAKHVYRMKVSRLNWLDSNYYDLAAEQRNERTKLMKEMVESYPDQEDFVLPTAFGNALRAFEVYPRVMYGFEGIDGWPRILAVLPKDYRELIDDAKAQVDWWVNLEVMSILFLIEFWYAVFSKWGLTSGWYISLLNIFFPLALFVIFSSIILSRATSAAIGWGDYVKSAFDLYRYDLLDALGIDVPKSREEERKLWTKYSQAIIFNLPENLQSSPRLTKKKISKGNERNRKSSQNKDDNAAYIMKGDFPATKWSRPLKIFLCHSSGDKEMVRKIYKKLIGEGWLDLWLDEEKLLPGDNWDMEISKAVRNSDIVIVCLSRESVNKEGYIQKEIRQALDVADQKPEGTIFIIPLKIEPCDVPERLSTLQWINSVNHGFNL